MNGLDATLARLPGLFAAHVQVSAAALALAIILALPLAALAARRPPLARAVLGLAGLVQTIPALALLALFYPLLLGLKALLGDGLSPLGFLPALLALTLYALLPILRNAVTGLKGVDPALRQAADGIGMTGWQRLVLVEAPLAAPTIMAGIRTAAVWTIGAATLASTIGQPSLGDLIFAGLQTQNWSLVLIGCAASATLALAADALLGLAESGLARRRRGRVVAAAGALALGVAAALLPLAPLGSAVERRPVITVGAKGFGEQFILARLIGRRLEAAGYRVRYREGLGSAVVFGALANDDIQVYADYSGTIWTNQMGRTDTPDSGAMLTAIGKWARREHGVKLLGPLGFENAYAFAVRAEDARRLDLETLDDLARASPALRLATDVEFLSRPEWAAIKAAYPMRFAETRSLESTFMYRALASGEADAITAFSSDGRIAASDFTVLRDPRGAIPRYDAILLLSASAAADPRLIAALEPLVGAIPVEMMRDANYRVDRDQDKQSPGQAAAWLDRMISADRTDKTAKEATAR